MKINKLWITNAILDLCDTRWELKKMKKQDLEVAWQFNNVSRNIRKRMKQHEEKLLNELHEIITSGLSTGNSKTFDVQTKTDTHTKKQVGELETPVV